MEPKKMGRPTDAPKHTQLGIRFDEETLSILDTFCQKENLSRAEARAFPMDESIERNPANMIWNVGLNAMAYGLEMGLRFSGLTPDDLEVQIVNDQKEGVF